MMFPPSDHCQHFILAIRRPIQQRVTQEVLLSYLPFDK
jgi:hypothetical protein